jgi:hypothetical protein
MPQVYTGMRLVLRGLSLIVLGAVLGCGVTLVAFRWHVVRASDGWHMIASGTSMPVDCYADVREWTPNDWADHPRLATAVVTAGQGDLVMRTGATNVIDRVINRR